MSGARRYNSTSVRGIIRQGEMILVEWLDSKGIAFLPGGTVEEGESLEQTLGRELAEEIEGARFTIGRYRGKIGHHWHEQAGLNSCLNHFFEVHYSATTELTAKEPGRCLRWIALTDPEAQRLQPGRLKALIESGEAALWDEIEGL